MPVSEVQIGVRMPKELAERVNVAAKHNKCAPSTFMRRLAEEQLGMVPKLEIPTPGQEALDFKTPAQGTPGRRRRKAA